MFSLSLFSKLMVGAFAIIICSQPVAVAADHNLRGVIENSREQPFVATDGTIPACIKKNYGAVRFVESGEECNPSEEPMTCNVVGPTGPIGKSMVVVATMEGSLVSVSGETHMVCSILCNRPAGTL